VCTGLDTPGSRRLPLHPVSHSLCLEGAAEGEGREDGRPGGKVEAMGEPDEVNVPVTEGKRR